VQARAEILALSGRRVFEGGVHNSLLRQVGLNAKKVSIQQGTIQDPRRLRINKHRLAN